MTTPSGPTYSYSGDPATSDKDAVRFLAQATGTTASTGFVSDEEIAWLLKQEPNIYLAAALVADRVSSYFGAMRQKTVGPLSISGTQQAQNYAQLAAKLRQQASLWTGAGDSGPQWAGDSMPSVLFDMGMHDYPDGSFLAPSQNLLGEVP